MPGPQQCAAVFSHFEPTTGKFTQFEVHLKDASGKPICEDSITGHITSLADNSTTDIPCTQVIFAHSYKPTQRGWHQLRVSVNGVEITSPFVLYIQHPLAQLGQLVRVINNLCSPYSVTITGTDYLLVAEYAKISMRNLYGEVIREFKSLMNGQQRLTGVALDSDGMMFVAEIKSHQLLKMCSEGKLLKAVGSRGKGSGQFDTPTAVALIRHKVWVCDMCNHRIQVFDNDLNHLNSFGECGSGENEFNYPRDLTSDHSGCVYIVDGFNHRVQVLTVDGTFLRAFGKHGSGPGELSYPAGIHVHQEHVYIVEAGNKRVSVFTTAGEFVSSFSVEQGGAMVGIAVDSHGYVYVFDHDNACIYVY